MPQADALRPPPAWTSALLLVILAVPYFINLDKSALWDGNETFYAETPREMLESGNYLAPMFNYEPRPQKPPLTYWIVLLGYRAVGVGELGVRLPSALAVVATILLTFAIARLLFNARAALLAAAMYATAFRVFILARKLPIDVWLILWTTAAAYFILRALSRDSTRDWRLAWLCAGLGFLTKGPVALAIPGSALLAWMLWSRRLSLKQTRPLSGVILILVVVLPWYLLTYLHYGWTYITDFFVQDNFARFATQVMGPVRGFHYYLPVFLVDFFPWSILCAAAAAYVWMERRRLRAEHSLSSGFPLIWTVATLVLFSLSRNKQEYYIAPIYPILAAWLAGIIDRTCAPAAVLLHRMRPFWTGAVAAVFLVLLAAAVAAPFFLSALIPDAAPVLHYAPAALVIVTAGVTVLCLWRRRLIAGIVMVAATVWMLLVIAGIAYLPAIESLRPVKEICRIIRQEARAEDEIGYYRAAVPSMLFYLQRPIFAASNPEFMVGKFQGEARVFCVVSPDDYAYFTLDRKVPLWVLGRFPQLPARLRSIFSRTSPSGEDLLLVSNRQPRSTGGDDRRQSP